MEKTIVFIRDDKLESNINKWIAKELDDIKDILSASSTTIVGRMIITYKV